MYWNDSITRLILGLRPANERRRYKVTPSLIVWTQTYTQPWYHYFCVTLFILGVVLALNESKF